MFLRQSGWSYETGSTGGLGIGPILGSGGKVILNDPSGTKKNFWYGGLGGGFGEEARLGKLKIPPLKIKGKTIGGSGSSTSYPSKGMVFMTDTFKGSELTESDIQGATVYIDAAAGILMGLSGSAMLLGINPLPLMVGLSNPTFYPIAGITAIRAPAVLIMGGYSVGLQAGAGIGLMVGYLR